MSELNKVKLNRKCRVLLLFGVLFPKLPIHKNRTLHFRYKARNSIKLWYIGKSKILFWTI